MSQILNKVPEVGERYRNKRNGAIVEVEKVTGTKGMVIYKANGKTFMVGAQVWQRLQELEQI